MDDQLMDWIDAISKIGGLVTVIVGVVLAIHQITKYRKQRGEEAQRYRDQLAKEQEQKEREIKINRANYWLELTKMFEKHDAVHRKLRGGNWPDNPDEANAASSSSGASQVGAGYFREPANEEWAELESYMGLFEHCKGMIDDGLIDFKTFESIYGYRVGNIVNHPLIRERKFMNEDIKKGWKIFLALAGQLGYEIG